MPNFDEAIRATEAMFAENEALEEEIPAEEVAPPEEVVEETPPAEEVPIEQQAQMVEENATLNEAVNTAEVAAQAAQEKETQLQEALREIEMLKAQNQTMQGTLDELSRQNEENIIEEAMTMPTLDVNGLAFATDEEVAMRQQEYAQKMAEFVKGGMMKELQPFIDQAKEGMREKEKNDALSSLSQVPELQGIGDMMPQLERIIASNKWLQSDEMPIDEKLINAYAIARGVNAINTPPQEPKELTEDELMELYDKNPTFQELIEKKRIESIKNSQQVPPFSASSGAVNAALNIPEKPKTFDEASKRTREMFGLS